MDYICKTIKKTTNVKSTLSIVFRFLWEFNEVFDILGTFEVFVTVYNVLIYNKGTS